MNEFQKAALRYLHNNGAKDLTQIRVAVDSTLSPTAAGALLANLVSLGLLAGDGSIAGFYAPTHHGNEAVRCNFGEEDPTYR